MNTYFIRHTKKFGVIDQAVEQLFSERKVGIHYPDVSADDPPEKEDCRSIDPDDYSETRYKIAMRCFQEVNREGGYIWAEYRDHDKILIGKVIRDSFEIFETLWAPGQFPYKRTALVKTLQLENAIELTPVQAMFLRAKRPRQGTIRRWHVANPELANLVTNKQISHTISNLSPDQQETVCAEFLYNSDNELIPQLKHLLMPVGRTLKDIDIYGYTVDGNSLFGQVTNHEFNTKQGKEKLHKLRNYMIQGSNTLLFCNHDRIEIIDDTIIIPLQRVEEWLVSDQEYVKQMFSL